MKFIKINKVLSCLDRDQKNSAALLISLMFFASIAELFGLGMVILMINSFLNIENNFNFSFGGYLDTNLNSINSLLILFLLIFTFKYCL